MSSAAVFEAASFIAQENAEKIKVFKVLPYLVSNVVEVRIFNFFCTCSVLTFTVVGH